MGEDEGLVLVQYQNRHLRPPLAVTNRKIPPPSMTARHATGEGEERSRESFFQGKRGPIYFVGRDYSMTTTGREETL